MHRRLLPTVVYHPPKCVLKSPHLDDGHPANTETTIARTHACISPATQDANPVSRPIYTSHSKTKSRDCCEWKKMKKENLSTARRKGKQGNTRAAAAASSKKEAQSKSSSIASKTTKQDSRADKRALRLADLKKNKKELLYDIRH
jgi:hypothetical protein